MPASSITPVTHVIYDLDGTLLDTEPIYLDVTNAIFARFGLVLPEAVREQMMGRPNPIAVRIMLEQTPLPMTAEAFLAERDVELDRRFRSVALLPGAERLTRHLATAGVGQAIATSTLRAAFEAKRSGHAEWFALFDAIVLAEEVRESKPAPDIFLEAARRLGADPATCLVFEDAAAGVAGALAAGMQVIGVPEPGQAHRVAEAHRVIDSLVAFDPTEWGLPPYPDALRDGDTT